MAASRLTMALAVAFSSSLASWHSALAMVMVAFLLLWLVGVQLWQWLWRRLPLLWHYCVQLWQWLWQWLWRWLPDLQMLQQWWCIPSSTSYKQQWWIPLPCTVSMLSTATMRSNNIMLQNWPKTSYNISMTSLVSSRNQCRQPTV